MQDLLFFTDGLSSPCDLTTWPFHPHSNSPPQGDVHELDGAKSDDDLLLLHLALDKKQPEGADEVTRHLRALASLADVQLLEPT